MRLFAIDLPILDLASTNRNILVGMGRLKERACMSEGRRVARLVLIVLFVGLRLSVEAAILGCIGASVVDSFPFKSRT